MATLGEVVTTSAEAAQARQTAQALSDRTTGTRATSYTSEQRNADGWSRWVQFTVGRGRRMR